MSKMKRNTQRAWNFGVGLRKQNSSDGIVPINTDVLRRVDGWGMIDRNHPSS